MEWPRGKSQITKSQIPKKFQISKFQKNKGERRRAFLGFGISSIGIFLGLSGFSLRSEGIS
jgi:hypothetical protein